MRPAFVLLHRYVGLALAGFLLLSGLTGSIIAFHHELDAWLNPELHRTPPGPALDPFELARRVEAADPRVRVSYLPFEAEPGHALVVAVAPRIDPATGSAFALDYDEVFVDAASGEVLGTRLWGCCLERKNLLPFLYVLHSNLHAPGEWGVWIMGGVALVWIVDCFVGAALTFPRGRPFLARWKPAWTVKRGASSHRLNLDLHRASGLWLWGLLLALAVSGVSLNLYAQVFEPAVSAVSPITPSVFDLRAPRPLDQPIEPILSGPDIVARAVADAAARGWKTQAFGVFYSGMYGVFGVGFGEDHQAGLGASWLYYDGLTGEALGGWLPGEGTAGDLFHQIQFPVHSGQIAGLAGRIVICAAGLVVALLSITGVVVWWKKRAARRPARAVARA